MRHTRLSTKRAVFRYFQGILALARHPAMRPNMAVTWSDPAALAGALENRMARNRLDEMQ
jgi:hypothetical protein